VATFLCIDINYAVSFWLASAWLWTLTCIGFVDFELELFISR